MGSYLVTGSQANTLAFQDGKFVFTGTKQKLELSPHALRAGLAPFLALPGLHWSVRGWFVFWGLKPTLFLHKHLFKLSTGL